MVVGTSALVAFTAFLAVLYRVAPEKFEILRISFDRAAQIISRFVTRQIEKIQNYSPELRLSKLFSVVRRLRKTANELYESIKANIIQVVTEVEGSPMNVMRYIYAGREWLCARIANLTAAPLQFAVERYHIKDIKIYPGNLMKYMIGKTVGYQSPWQGYEPIVKLGFKKQNELTGRQDLGDIAVDGLIESAEVPLIDEDWFEIRDIGTGRQFIGDFGVDFVEPRLPLATVANKVSLRDNAEF